jgi:hypothetical protein
MLSEEQSKGCHIAIVCCTCQLQARHMRPWASSVHPPRPHLSTVATNDYKLGNP